MKIWFYANTPSIIIILVIAGMTYALPIFSGLLMWDFEAVGYALICPLIFFMYTLTWGLIHVYAIARVWDVSWGTRPGAVAVDAASKQEEERRSLITQQRKRTSQFLLGVFLGFNIFVAAAGGSAKYAVKGTFMLDYVVPTFAVMGALVYIAAASYMIYYAAYKWASRMSATRRHVSTAQK